MPLHFGGRKHHVPEESPVARDAIPWVAEKDADWYRDLVEHSHDLLCVHDLEGRFLSINPVPARLLGYSMEEMIRTPMREFVDPRFRGQFDTYLSEIASTGEARGLLAVLTRSGEQRIWEYHNTLRTEGVPTPIVRGIAHDVTERVRTEKSLRASEERLRLAQESAQIGMFERDLVRGNSRWSPQMETIYGLPPGGFPRTLDEFLKLIHPDDQQQAAQLISQSLETGEAHGEWRVIWPDGSVRWIAGRWRVFKDPQGRPLRAIGMDFDITERKRAEEALRANDAELQEAQRVAHLGSWRVNLKTLAVTGSEQMYRIMGVDPESAPQSFGELGRLFPPDSWQRVLQAHQRTTQNGKPEEIEIEFLRRDGTTGWILTRAETDIDPAGNVASVHGTALDITERKRAEEALQASEERYRSVVSAMAEGVLLRDADGKILACNRSFEQMLGVTSEQMVGTTAADWEARTIHEDGSPFAAEDHPAMVALHTGRPQSNIRMGFRRPDGRSAWISINAQPIFRSGEGKPHAVVTTFADITEQKQAEAAISDLVQQVRGESSESFFNSTAQQLARCLEADYTMIGELVEGEEDKVHTIAVCDRGTIVDNFTYDLAHTPCAVVVQQSACSYAGGVTEIFPQDHLLKELKVEGYVGTPLRNSQGRVVGIMVALYTRPLTNAKFAEMILQMFSTRTAGQIERKHTEEALRQSEAELRQAQRIGQMASWYRDLTTDRVTWSEQFYRFLGKDPKEQAMQFADIERFLTPESRQRLIQATEKLLSTGERDQFEVEFRCLDGTPGWAVLHREAVRDKADKIAGIRGVALDITERKQAEEALRQSEERFRVALKHSPIAVFNQDRDLRYTWMYDTQDPLDDYLGKTPSELFGPEEGEPIMEVRRRVLETGVGVRHLMHHTLNGQNHHFDSTIEPVLDSSGAVIGLTGASMDITERKQAEEALRQSEERFRVALKHSPIAVFNQDRDLRYTWMYNPQLSRPLSDLVGSSPVEFFGTEEGKRITEIRRRVLETGVGVRHEIQIVDQGKKRYLDTTIEPVLDATGAVIGLTGASMDITSLRETSEALREAQKKLTEEKLYLEQEINTELGFGEIIGQSKALQAVMENVHRVASSDATVLLLGETGTGKELVARAIHRLSKRADKSFIKTNCAAIPTGLLESELFGNEKGAFTGAVSKKIGRLELADKGTLFLDEIGEISLVLQPKLLRVLQDHEFERLGGTQTLKVDFRLIAATNRDLATSVRENEFRSDLYYRLNVFPIRVPPLRERREDIRLLVEHFVQKFTQQMKKTITSIPKKTMDALMGWEWPGNVRELENFIERSVILTRGSVLAVPLSELQALTPGEGITDETLEAAEREHILRVMQETRGQIGGAEGAAARLGMKRTTLQSKLKRLGISPQGGPREQ